MKGRVVLHWDPLSFFGDVGFKRESVAKTRSWRPLLRAISNTMELGGWHLHKSRLVRGQGSSNFWRSNREVGSEENIRLGKRSFANPLLSFVEVASLRRGLFQRFLGLHGSSMGYTLEGCPVLPLSKPSKANIRWRSEALCNPHRVRCRFGDRDAPRLCKGQRPQTFAEGLNPKP